VPGVKSERVQQTEVLGLSHANKKKTTTTTTTTTKKHNRTLKSVFEIMLVAVAPVQHIRFVAF